MTRARWLLALCAALAFAACGRSERPDAPSASFTGGGLHVEVSSASGPLRTGANELRVRVRDAQGAPVDDARVSLDYTMEMAGMAPMAGRARAESLGRGEYRAEANLEMAGTWQLEVAAERAPGSAARARGSLRTGSAAIELQAPGTAEKATGVVRVDPQRLQKLGVRFAVVERAPLVRTIRATGPGDLGRVEARRRLAPGRRLRARAARRRLGAQGREGRATLLGVQRRAVRRAGEYLAAARAGGSSGAAPKRRARGCACANARPGISRRRRALEKRGAPLRGACRCARRRAASWSRRTWSRGRPSSPAPGCSGSRRSTGSGSTRRSSSPTLPFVSVGQSAIVALRTCPGARSTRGSPYVLPVARRARRAPRARASSSRNADLALRPEMWVEVELRADLGEQLLVPGLGGDLRGRAPRRVRRSRRGPARAAHRRRSGSRTPTRSRSSSGLEPGERVVASGNFLIAAESRLQSALEQW